MPCAYHYDRPEPYDDLESGCQFRPEEKMYPHGGNDWCRFHLPLEAKDQEGYIKRDWVDDKRNNFFEVLFKFVDGRNGSEPVDLTGVQFLHRTDFRKYSGQGPGKRLKAGVFARAVFGIGCNFDDVIFEDQCIFDAATIGDDTSFNRATFGDGSSFTTANFGTNCQFSGAGFGVVRYSPGIGQ